MTVFVSVPFRNDEDVDNLSSIKPVGCLASVPKTGGGTHNAVKACVQRRTQRHGPLVSRSLMSERLSPYSPKAEFMPCLEPVESSLHFSVVFI